MIQLKSVVDGFQVILGTMLTNLAALLTLAIVIRGAPEYEEPDRQSKAIGIYWALFCSHLVLFLAKLSNFVKIPGLSDFITTKLTLLTLGELVILSYMCSSWVYSRPVNDLEELELTLDQRRFENWLLVEMLLVVGYIAGGVSYLVFASFKHPTLEQYCPTFNSADTASDYIIASQLLIDSNNNMFAPAFVAVFLSCYLEPEQMKEMMQLTGYVSIFQSLLYFVSIFATRVNERRSKLYIDWMPEICYYCGIGSQLVGSFGLILLNLEGMLLIDEVSELTPFLAFTVLNQILVVINYGWLFSSVLTEDLEFWRKERIAYEMIRKGEKKMLEDAKNGDGNQLEVPGQDGQHLTEVTKKVIRKSKAPSENESFLIDREEIMNSVWKPYIAQQKDFDGDIEKWARYLKNIEENGRQQVEDTTRMHSQTTIARSTTTRMNRSVSKVEEDLQRQQKILEVKQGQEQITKIIESQTTPYLKKERTAMSGALRFGKGLILREDFYAANFLHQFKVEELFGPGKETKASIQGGISEDERRKANRRIQFKNNFEAERVSMNGRFRFLFILQVLLTFYLGREAFMSEDMLDAYKSPPTSVRIVLTRFLCAVFLHISLAEEIQQGFDMQKYAMNHPWKFESWTKGWFVGFCQMSILFAVEFVNLVVLLSNETIMDTLMNFLALVIIADFDDYMFQTIKTLPLSKLISDGTFNYGMGGEERSLQTITQIVQTTSQEARFSVEGNKIEEALKFVQGQREEIAGDQSQDFFENPMEESENGKEKQPTFIYLDWSDRSYGNKLVRLLYILLKAFYKSAWFYFIPFTSFFLSYQIPYSTSGQAIEDVIGRDDSVEAPAVVSLFKSLVWLELS